MRFIIDEFNEGIRVDSYLAEIMQDVSRSKIQKFIKNGLVKVNDKSVKSSCVLREDDVVTINEGETVNRYKIVSENIPIQVVWEDENMVVINKPSGMLTHPTVNETSGTLVNALLYKYGENLSDVNGEMRRGIVHRLDKNTSGLLMVAKNNITHDYKQYLAIVKGILENDEYTINTPIGRHPTKPYKQAVREDGKDSLTIVKVLKRFEDATLINVNLITGRTHQIRVHMSSIGHPVYNDTLYGFGKMRIKTEEQVLQSYKLEFIKPFTENRITLEIPPDDKVVKVINYLSIND